MIVLSAIAKMAPVFTQAQLVAACPGVSRDMIRKILKDRRGTLVECLGKGPGAKWRRREGAE